MNGPRDCHNEWSKSGTEWEISYDVWYKWTCSPKSNRLTDFEYEILVTRGKRWGEGTVREFEINMNTLLYLKWITNETLLYSTENSAQCYVATEWEGSLGENGCMYVYDWVTLPCTWNRHVLSRFIRVWLLAAPWTTGRQAPPFVDFSRQDILEWAPMLFSRGSFRPRDWTHISFVSCIGRRVLYH